MSKNFANAATNPLEWPTSFTRTKRVESSRFRTSLYQALTNVKTELSKFASDSGKKMESVVISSNYSLSDTSPSDAGVCVYFVWDGEQTCIPVDRYTKLECNLQAIFHCIEAKRTILRHGGINLVKAAFRGYAALPSPTNSSLWHNVLGVEPDAKLDEIKRAYKRKIAKAHPDSGGNASQAARINKAWEQAKSEYSNE